MSRQWLVLEAVTFSLFSIKPRAIPLIPSIFGSVRKMVGIENEVYFYLEALGVQRICVR